MMTAARRGRFEIDPSMLWILLFVVSSDGLTVAGIAALATGDELASSLALAFGIVLAISLLALWCLVQRLR